MGKQDLVPILVVRYFNLAVLVSNVLVFNAGGARLATSWKMCITSTLGLACNKHASVHTGTRRLRGSEASAQHKATLSDDFSKKKRPIHHFLFQVALMRGAVGIFLFYLFSRRPRGGVGGWVGVSPA